MNEQKALAGFRSGLNCAQSVFSVFAEKYGVDEELAFRIAGGMGSGFRSGEICGAVSGAVLVIGLKFGQSSADDMEAKRNCYAKTEEFIKLYRERYGAIVCRDILGCDISTKEGREQANRENLFKTVCEDVVSKAVKLLLELGY